MKKITQTPGYQIIQQWMAEKGNEPFSFQKETWQAFAQRQSGLVVAPTGFGKTFSVFLSVIIDFLNHPEQHTKGLKLLWVTPLRSLSKDIAKAMQTAIDEMGLDWVAGVRNGDISPSEKQKQTRQMPEILVVTPESLHLLMAQKSKTKFFENLQCIAVDEWHELLGTKRGVMVELAIAHLRHIATDLKIWGLTATIGNIEEALEVLVPYNVPKKIITAKEKKKIEILSVLPDEIELLPWAGHMGSKLVDKILPIIEQSKTTLIFTNTRNQAEQWYQNLLNADPHLAGQLAIHHSSIDMELRTWIEDHLASGYLKAVVSTSSLDLGVDFKPVDTVIQIGSSKGVARFLQRAGRSGHSPFETSKIYFVPTHSLELIEVAALKEAHRTHQIEKREPVVLAFDVLVQFLVTLAVGEGFREEELYPQILSTHCFSLMTEEEWRWALQFITIGGKTLKNYEEYHKVVVEDGVYKVTSRRVAMLHRMNLGVIVSDVMMKVKFFSGGYIGMIEEYFISRLKKGDAFILAGRVLEIVNIKEQEISVKLSKKKTGQVASYLGGRLPMTSYLSHFLREKLNDSLSPNPKEVELKFLQPLLLDQEDVSHIPKSDEFLVEKIENKYGYHLFMYPFEGRLVHEVMSALIAYRISRLFPISFTMAMNDYGFELSSDKPIPIEEKHLPQLLSKENLIQDVMASINAAEMAKRKFRDISVISGLVLQNYYGNKKKFKSIQSSSNLIFQVLEDYEPSNLLLRQAYSEVFNHQLEEVRLREAFERISQSKIVFEQTTEFTPLSFPIRVDSLRQSLSSEDLASRIERMVEYSNKKKK